MKNIRIIFLSLLSLILATGCDDNDDPFNGGDNYVTSFKILQDGLEFDASFVGDSIVVSVPSDFSLTGAEAKVVLSENAKLMPDPSSITDWDEDILFGITSYNGSKKQYRYVVKREGKSENGIVLLNTQQEIDEFGKKGITVINGSLIIGNTIGKDSIRSLTPLSGLEHVSYNLTINGTYAGTDIIGLENLKSVGASLLVTSANQMTSFSLPKIVKIGGDLRFNTTALYQIDLPQLKTVGSTIELRAPYTTVNMSALESVSEDLLITPTSYTMVKNISFPLLQEVKGKFQIQSVPSLKKIECHELTRCGALTISTVNVLNVIYFPKLEEISESLNVNLAKAPVSDISFPLLKKAGGVSFSSTVTGLFDLSSLKTVDKDLNLSLVGAIDMDKLKSLETIGGIFTIAGDADKLILPTALSSIGVLSLKGEIKEIDIRNITIGELQIAGKMYSESKIIADDVFKGGIFVQASVADGKFPTLEGFKEIEYLKFDYIQTNVITIPNIAKVKADVYIPYNNMQALSFTDLEEIGGDFVIMNISNSTQEIFEVAKLKSVGGDMSIGIHALDTKTIRFPLLSTVSGDLKIGTGYTAYGQDRSVKSLSFPALESVHGTISLSPDWQNPTTSLYNDALIELNGFTNLKTVVGFNIYNHKALVSYEGLKQSIPAFVADNWIVSGNAYNPSYADFSNGLWVKP